VRLVVLHYWQGWERFALNLAHYESNWKQLSRQLVTGNRLADSRNPNSRDWF